MKTTVITGSAWGFGLCQARKFRSLGCNVVLSDVNEDSLKKAAAELEAMPAGDARIMWLSNRRAFGRFLTAGFKKRDFFS